jgi:3-isopropylmalate/(R)-2-methylmalate dehydratase small subunit
VGLPIFECPEAAASIETGDEVTVDPVSGTIENRTKGMTFRVAPFAPFLQELISEGGLIPYARRRIEERRKGA